MTREEAANYINGLQPEFLQPAKERGQFICPNCGHGKGGDGLRKHNGHWKCFGPCGENHNIVGWYAIYMGVQDTPDNYTEALEGAATWYGISIDGTNEIPTNTRNISATTTEKKTQEINTNMDYFKECQKRITETEYIKLRGISLKTCEDLGIGYDPSYKTFEKLEKGTKAATWKALIIPTQQGSFIARNTNEYADDQNRIRKEGKAKMLYAPRRFTNKPIFIVEGEIDAISIYEAGGQAIGIGGTSGIDKLTQTIIENAAKLQETQVIIPVLDNDDPGQTAQETLERLLVEAGIKIYTPVGFYGAYKDANDFLKADPEGLKAKVDRTAAEALANIENEKKKAAEEYRKENNVANQLQAFINGIADSVNTPPIRTGFFKLDEALEGGLFEGLYCLGAVSSLGKTTLAMQIGDQIAQTGRDVLIISLEMARSQLIAKSLSRHTLLETMAQKKKTDLAKTSRGITTGARYASYSEEEKQLINTAICKYAEYAKNLYIKGDIGKIGTDEIREAVKKHKEITGNAPILIIDYLQILKAYDVRATDKRNIDENVVALKQLSRDYKIPVIVISSFNRDGYKGGAKEATMTDFKESGAIEYGADVLIGLHFKGAGQASFDLEAAYNNEPREVELKILKNREGKPGQRIAYNYYPKFNYFEEI